MSAVSVPGLHCESKPGPFLVWLMAGLVIVHIGIAVLLPDIDTRFQLGDRAWDRAMKLDALIAQTSLDGVLATLFRYDQPGDYILFLPAYALFGAPGVIAQNLLFLLIGVYYLYRLCETWFSPAVARITTVAWLALPATLFHPHVLASEAICNPLLIAATYYAARLLGGERMRTADAVWLGLIAAVLIFVRPFYLLLPPAIAILLLFREGRPAAKLKQAAIVCALSLSLTGLWQGALLVNAGRYPVEPSFHGLASNLYLRAARVEAVGDYRLPEHIRQSKTMTPGEFATLALTRPLELGRTYLSDAVNIAGNTGVNMVHGRFFGLFDLKEDRDADVFKWRDVRDREGLPAMLAMLWETSPAGLMFNLAAIAIWGAMLLLAAWGLICLAANVALPALLRLLLPLVPAYAIAFSFVSGSVRWDHRSPADFAICIFFAIGAATLFGRPPLRATYAALSE